MKKSQLLIAIFAMLIGKIYAGPVDAQRAQQLGQRFLSAATGLQHTEIQLVHTTANRNDVDYYVFNVGGNNGFVIIAGDDRVKPILAYSTTGCFNPNDISEGFEFKLNSFRQEIQYVREHNLEATTDIVSEWNSVSKNGNITQGRGNRAVVGPLCQSTWNQNYPYNGQCPKDPSGSGIHVYAGCVATAMAQIMKYWNYPDRGTGSHTYTPTGFLEQTANFGETDYHFELMPNDLDSLSTEEECFYVAQLIHHCGVAVEMSYGLNGSGAYSDDVIPALRTYFKYSCDEMMQKNGPWGLNFYTNEEWALVLKNQGLNDRIPLFYAASDDSGAGGHAFVCDGYDENDYFHFNWGWSGKDDAWCPIGALNTTKYAFNEYNAIIGHIQPLSPNYYQRPENITDFNVIEYKDETNVKITWTNPEHSAYGGPLNDLTVYLYRDGEEIYRVEGRKGEAITFIDMALESGLYQYSLIAENEFGFNQTGIAQILVGNKCDIIFELSDTGGDGWKGACISVTAEDGQRIAKITMKEGSAKTIVMPLLTQRLNFIWNHGWFHTDEQYDTDYECSFVIKNASDEVIYTSGEHSDGVFLEYDNICDDAVEETTAISDLSLYPNPTDGLVNIEAEGAMTISVLNILGQKILEMNATDNAIIDLNCCESGIYMIKVETVNGTKVEKVNKR